jgi:hypothetical protein
LASLISSLPARTTYLCRSAAHGRAVKSEAMSPLLPAVGLEWH